MINFKKYALAAALVIPSVFAVGLKDADAAKLTIDKDLASAVNVRREAAMGDNIVGLIDDSDKAYQVISEEGDWTKIKFNDKEAYVATRFFHVLDEDKIIVDTNFRKGPSLDDEVIRVLPAGEVVEVLEISENGYVKVVVGEEEGYVYHNLLETFRKANEEKAAVEATQAQSAPAQSTNSQPVAQAQTTQQAAPAQTYQAPAEESYQGSSNWAKEWIAQRESNGSYTAYNPNGGYYGRYQLNPSLIHYGASPAEQEAAADAYVAQRYGSWEAAQAFWAANGWY